MRTAVLLVVGTLLGACSVVSTIGASPGLPSFSYQLEPATEVMSAGDALHLEWAPHPDSNYTTLTSDVTLCFAFFGPWPDAATLKRESKTPGSNPPTCPAAGAATTSLSVRTTTAAGTRLKTEAVVPTTPGFYNLRQITLIGPTPYATYGSRGGSTTSDRIVEVRGR